MLERKRSRNCASVAASSAHSNTLFCTRAWRWRALLADKRYEPALAALLEVCAGIGVPCAPVRAS